MEEIFFNDTELSLCKDFSEQVDTSLYAQRNQFDSQKRKADSKIGKLGELLVYNILSKKYPTLTYPDFKIYKPREKSWDYDLKHETFNLHVKTQEALQASRFGQSWIFQLEDKHIFKNYKDNDYVAFVYLNVYKNFGTIKNIVPVKILHEMNLFKKPVLAKLYNKTAVYFEDIQSIIPSLKD
jgi:hypothetical protein